MTANESIRPNPLPLRYRILTNWLSLPLLVIATILFGSVALLASLFDRKGRVQHRIAQMWAWVLVRVTFAQLKIEGAEHLRTHKTAVYVSNHASYMDTPVIFSTLPFQFRILARKQLWKIPFIGWYLDRSGQIPIDTENPHASMASLGGGLKALRGGMNIFVFPEGGRTPDGNLREFLSGAAYLAIRAKTPIVPMALVGLHELLPMHTRHFYPCKIALRVGEPIDTEKYSLKEIEALNAKLREVINTLITKE